MKIICYMMMSLDGRIDCEMTEKINGSEAYYDILKEYAFDAYVVGKVTAAMHYADGCYKTEDNTPIGEMAVFLPLKEKNYVIVTDTRGSLRWNNNKVGNDNLLVLLSQDASKEYLAYLRSLNISYIAVGKQEIDFKKAVKILNEELNINNLGVLGGGNLNAAFLKCHLIDEVSVLIGPGIDGRKGMTSLFDGLAENSDVYQLKLKSVNAYEDSSVLLKYTVLY